MCIPGTAQGFETLPAQTDKVSLPIIIFPEIEEGWKLQSSNGTTSTQGCDTN